MLSNVRGDLCTCVGSPSFTALAAPLSAHSFTGAPVCDGCQMNTTHSCLAMARSSVCSMPLACRPCLRRTCSRWYRRTASTGDVASNTSMTRDLAGACMSASIWAASSAK